MRSKARPLLWRRAATVHARKPVNLAPPPPTLLSLSEPQEPASQFGLESALCAGIGLVVALAFTRFVLGICFW